MILLIIFDWRGGGGVTVRAQWFIRGVDAEINLFWISGQHYHKKALCCVFHKNNYNHIFSVLPVFVPEHEVIRSDLDHCQKKRRQTEQKVLVILWRFSALPFEDVGCN